MFIYLPTSTTHTHPRFCCASFCHLASDIYTLVPPYLDGFVNPPPPPPPPPQACHLTSYNYTLLFPHICFPIHIPVFFLSCLVI